MKDLIERLKKKDEAALKEVMSMYKNQIHNYLYVMTGNSELAEELTQDTFVKVYFKAGSLKTIHLKAWIFKIATNLARSEFRKQKFKNLLPLADVPDSNAVYETGIGKTIEVEQLVSALPAKLRIPVVMKELNNFSFEEIAEILKKPIGTVKSLVFRGRTQIKENSQPVLQNGGTHG